MSRDDGDRMGAAMSMLREVFLERVEQRLPVTIVSSDGELLHYAPNPSKGEDNWRCNTSWGESPRNDVERVRAEVRGATGYVVSRQMLLDALQKKRNT